MGGGVLNEWVIYSSNLPHGSGISLNFISKYQEMADDNEMPTPTYWNSISLKYDHIKVGQTDFTKICFELMTTSQLKRGGLGTPGKNSKNLRFGGLGLILRIHNLVDSPFFGFPLRLTAL